MEATDGGVARPGSRTDRSVLQIDDILKKKKKKDLEDGILRVGVKEEDTLTLLPSWEDANDYLGRERSRVISTGGRSGTAPLLGQTSFPSLP